MDLVMRCQVIRLKGRLWLPGKALPLQVQMVGPRLNSWFEAAPEKAWRPEKTGVDLVVLSLKSNAADEINREIQLASNAEATPNQ